MGEKQIDLLPPLTDLAGRDSVVRLIQHNQRGYRLGIYQDSSKEFVIYTDASKDNSELLLL